MAIVYSATKNIRRLNMVNYVIQRTPRSQAFITHIDRLKKFEGISVCWKKSETEAASTPGPGDLQSSAGGKWPSDNRQRSFPVTAEAEPAEDLTAQNLRELLNRNVPTREQCWRLISSTMRCVLCGSGLKKHMLLKHGKRHRRNRSPESVPKDELKVLVKRYRYHQANSKNEKNFKQLGCVPRSAGVCSRTPALCHVHCRSQ